LPGYNHWGIFGKRLLHDQYIDVKILMTVCKGEFWGITKTSLLGNESINEKIGVLKAFYGIK